MEKWLALADTEADEELLEAAHSSGQGVVPAGVPPERPTLQDRWLALAAGAQAGGDPTADDPAPGGEGLNPRAPLQSGDGELAEGSLGEAADALDRSDLESDPLQAAQTPLSRCWRE